jgi:Trypsin-like peptidase domain
MIRAVTIFLSLALTLPALASPPVAWQPSDNLPVTQTVPAPLEGKPAQCPGGQCPPGNIYAPPGFFPQQPQYPQQPTQRQPKDPVDEMAPVPAELRAACVRISGQKGGGSGTVFHVANGQAYILTCKHVISYQQPVTVSWPNGATAPGKVVAVDPRTDLTCLSVEAKTPMAYVPVAEAMPSKNEPLWQAGFPAWLDGRARYLVRRSGKFIGYYGQSNGQNQYAVGVRCSSGDSGSGVFSANGKTLIGVLWGTSSYDRVNETTCVTGSPEMRRFIKETCHLNIQFGPLLRPRQPTIPPYVPPGQPPTQPPYIPPAQPPATPGDPATAAEIARIKAEIDAIKATPALPGPKGETGPAGPAGPQGQPGSPGTPADAARVDAALSAAQQADTKAAENQSRIGGLIGKLDTIAPKVEKAISITETVTHIAATVPGPWQGPAVIASGILGVAGAGLGAFGAFRKRRAQSGTVLGPAAGAGPLGAGAGSQPPIPPAPAVNTAQQAQLDALRLELERLRNQPAQIVVNDTPAPPPIVRHEKTFTPYEVPSLREKALDMAMDDLVRRQPGSVGTLEQLKSAIDQFESGLRGKAKAA